jgi:hypothetical protein
MDALLNLYSVLIRTMAMALSYCDDALGSSTTKAGANS